MLKYYTDHTQYIAIGGTAISRIKGYTKKFRIKIIREIMEMYPNRHFSFTWYSCPYIIEACPDLYSIDGQAWLVKVNDRKQKLLLSEKKIEGKIEYIRSKKTDLNLFNFHYDHSNFETLLAIKPSFT
ncbi:MULTISPECIES: hypothetical protein [Metabacillus]|uniref:hypothetical protein n=2 Tax=Bacillaceae TaxID=186817 RepID=UPI001E58D443|nr:MULTISPECIES: hypothetical protein [Metabacillus]MCM3164510.1 hypothetical protein [Metabacillus litoralis]UGB33673.1 hypothetical protein LPC09_25805 [Metabacillus sp. B2-18]